MNDHRNILVLSHAGCSNGKVPFGVGYDSVAAVKAKVSLTALDIKFDGVFGPDCPVVRQTARHLFPHSGHIPILCLHPSSKNAETVRSIVDDLGMFPDVMELFEHPRFNSLIEIVEKVVDEVVGDMDLPGANNVAVILFPPMTNLFIQNLRSDERGGSCFERSLVGEAHFSNCSGFFLENNSKGMKRYRGVDRPFPFTL